MNHRPSASLRALAHAALIAALALPAVAQAGRHRLEGVVQDRNGEPVNRAIVSLLPGNVQLMTDREGNFLIDYLRDAEGERVRFKKRTTYTVEVFKPGFHTQALNVEYRSGPLALPSVTLVEESIELKDTGENLDPGLFKDPTHAAGAAYEGQ